MLVVLLTPHTADSFFNDSHLVASAVLFAYGLSFAGLLARHTGATVVTVVRLLVESAAAVLVMLFNLHVVYYLSEVILIFQLVFSTHLAYDVNRWLRLAVGTPNQ